MNPSAAVLVDISGSKKITASYCVGHVIPCIRQRIRRASALTSSTRPSVPQHDVRLVVFSTAAPSLQHSSWAASWAAYTASLTTNASGVTSFEAHATSAWGEPYPLIGPTPKLPILLSAPLELNGQEGGATEGSQGPALTHWLEGVRVDDYIPVRTQLVESVRYLLQRRRPRVDSATSSPWGLRPIAVVGIVVPDHLQDQYRAFLVELQRRGGRSTEEAVDPAEAGGHVEVLLYNSCGLQHIVNL